MTALATGDVTITLEKQYNVAGTPPRRRNRIKIAFGDGSLTYPSGGVPLPSADVTGMGLPGNVLEYIVPLDTDSADGYVWKYDNANQKLRGYQANYATGTAGPLVELATSAAPAAQTLYAEAVGY